MRNGEGETGRRRKRSRRRESKIMGRTNGKRRDSVSDKCVLLYHMHRRQTLGFLKLYIVFSALVICQEKIHVGVDICIPCRKTFCPKGVFRIWSGTCGLLTTKRPPFCDEQIECEALIPFNRCPPPAFCDADAGHSARVKQACYPFMPLKLPFINKSMTITGILLPSLAIHFKLIAIEWSSSSN